MIGRCNPFNIRSYKRNRWQGQSGSRKGFCEFYTREYGIRAMCILIRNYIRNGVNTPSKVINRFAPPCENNTVDYLNFVLSKSGVHDSFFVSEYHVILIIHYMSVFEGNEVSVDEINSVVSKYNIHFNVTGL